MLATLADLVRDNAYIIVECAKCKRLEAIYPFQLNDGRREPEALPEMETKLIADIVPRLRCRGYPCYPCGGRVKEWWSTRRFSYGPISDGP